MKRIYLFVLLLITNIAFSGEHLANININTLLKDPQKYDGKIVEVVGFANIEFEGNALYLDQKSQKDKASDKGLWLEIAKTPFELNKFNGSKVLVKGTFKLSNKGHMNLWKGALEQVTKLELAK